MNIDLIIILGYLVVTLFVGFYYGRGVKTVRDYAIGDRNFSTTTLVMTMAATWISGSGTLTRTTEAFKIGIAHSFCLSSMAIAALITAYILAPRMYKFFNLISVGEIMQELYGKYGQ